MVTTKVGLKALLTPDECVLVLIDHQVFQFTNLHSHEPTMVVNNVVALAKTAKIFNIPTILTTVLEERGGFLLKPLQDVYPDQKPINRTFINTWEDQKVTDAVKATGRKKIIMAVRRIVAAGAIPMTWMAVAGELQRDWAREETGELFAQLLTEHGGASTNKCNSRDSD